MAGGGGEGDARGGGIGHLVLRAIRIAGRAWIFIGVAIGAALLLLSIIRGDLRFGCPALMTSQVILFRITSSASKQPLAEAQVSLRLNTPGVVEAERRGYPFQWFSGVTGANGQVEIDAQWPALDRSIGPKPPASRDWGVPGEPYLVRVSKNGEDEDLDLIIRPSASVKGRAFTVQILTIGDLRYIK